MKQILSLMFASMLIVGSTFAYAEDVYATKNGKRYHKVDCLLIQKKGAKPIAMEEALKKGLKACKKCFSTDTSANNSAAVVQPPPVAAN